MLKIGIISCVSKKLEGSHQAKDMYRSSWFLKAKNYVETNFKHWFILSAKHGLLSPDTVIESYNIFLKETNRDYKYTWGNRVTTQILAGVPNGSELHLLAGSCYRKPIEALSDKYTIVVPMRGMGIGEQLQWLKNKQNELPTNQ